MLGKQSQPKRNPTLRSFRLTLYRHYVQDSEPTQLNTSLTSLNTRRTISQAMALARPLPGEAPPKNPTGPAQVTIHLGDAVSLSTAQLEGLTGYNSVAVHTTSQTLLQNMMLFHMEADARTNFLQTQPPQNLPIELGSNLQSDLKTWIRNTYGPAYISFMISQIKSGTVNWRGNFDDTQKEKIWYWWSGSVCLAYLVQVTGLLIANCRALSVLPCPLNTTNSTLLHPCLPCGNYTEVLWIRTFKTAAPSGQPTC